MPTRLARPSEHWSTSGGLIWLAIMCIMWRLGRWVRASYGLASAYVLADTADKGGKQARQPGADTKAVAVAAVDTLLWQAFASVIVPGAPHSTLLLRARMPSFVALQVSL